VRPGDIPKVGGEPALQSRPGLEPSRIRSLTEPMTRTVLTTFLALLAVPAAAHAAPVKISPEPSAVSSAGVATVEVANPNRHVLKGTAAVTAGTRTIASRNVKLAKRSVSAIALRFDPQGVAALRAAGGRATIKLALRRAGGRKSTARRTITLRLPAASPQAPAPAGAPGTPGGPATPAPPASDRWAGRMGAEGPYDDLELTVVGGQMHITKAPLVPVMCFENGGSFRSALSFELFDAPGPWTVGTDANVAKTGIATNQLVSSGSRGITYKVTGTSRQAGRLTGTLGMSFSDSKLDFPSYKLIFVNCFGSQSFEAVPAP